MREEDAAVVPPFVAESASIGVTRDGIQFPPPLAAGLAIEAVVVHAQRAEYDSMSFEEFYFVWRGKMWKAATA